MGHENSYSKILRQLLESSVNSHYILCTSLDVKPMHFAVLASNLIAISQRSLKKCRNFTRPM